MAKHGASLTNSRDLRDADTKETGNAGVLFPNWQEYGNTPTGFEEKSEFGFVLDHERIEKWDFQLTIDLQKLDSGLGKRLSDLVSWVLQFHKEIDELSLLEDNWDNEGALRIREECIQAAKHMVSLLLERGIICTSVGGTVEGGVELLAENDIWELIIDIDDGSYVDFFVVRGKKKRSGKVLFDEAVEAIWSAIVD